jgi:hypothetical protein
MSRSGISAQLGFAEESAWGTIETPDRFLPLLPGETLSQQIERIESEAIRAGRLTLDEDDWHPGGKTVAGTLPLELYNVTIGKLLEHAMGDVVTTGASAPYTHTFTPDLLYGKGLTIQIGRPGVLGTVHPFTYAGCKITGWEVACQVGQIARLNLDVIGKEETTADEALAAASYAAGLKPFVYTQGTITIGGSPVNVKSARVRGSNGLPLRQFLGSDLTAEPIDAGDLRVYDGELTCEFEDLTAYNRFVNGTTAAVVLEFDNGTDSLTITLGKVRFDGTTPTVSGRDVLEQPVPIKAVGATDAGACTLALVTSDATP